MNRKTPNAPKRRSQPPPLSRDDCQINPQEQNLHALGFRPIPCGKNGKEQYYRLQLDESNDNIDSLDAVAEELRISGLNLHVSAVESVLNTLFDVLPKYMAKTGHAVRIGNLVTLKPYATGTIAHENDAADKDRNHVEIRATICPALRYSLKNLKLVNNARSGAAVLRSVSGGEGLRADIVDEAHETQVTGRGIYVPVQTVDSAAVEPGRVWLETLEGERVGRFDVTHSSEALLRLRLHVEMANPPSECQLVVETCGTAAAAESGTAPLLRYDRRVTLVRP